MSAGRLLGREPAPDDAGNALRRTAIRQIKTEHYEPAFDVALAEARADIEAIARNPEPPTFDNTIVALERSGNRLNSVATIFSPSRAPKLPMKWMR